MSQHPVVLANAAAYQRRSRSRCSHTLKAVVGSSCRICRAHSLQSCYARASIIPALMLRHPLLHLAGSKCTVVGMQQAEVVVEIWGVQIDILVVNCSLFNPTPSLSAMIVNHFKMRSNIVSYNLGGMGCSAGVIAVGLAREQLQVCHWSAGWSFSLHCSPVLLVRFEPRMSSVPQKTYPVTTTHAVTSQAGK